MGWTAHLDLQYRRDGDRTTALDRHEGPLRVLQRLYPEGPGICHHIVVHPPGGVVGGDVLELQARLAPGSHALITTPGATRFYRSDGPEALQSVQVRMDADTRLEWLPMETIAYRGCRARSRVQLDLAPGAETLGWDVLALGLPAGRELFDHGEFQQEITLPGQWLERGTVRGDDTLLLDSPLGWAGHRVLATAWWAAGEALSTTRRDAMLEGARSVIDGAVNAMGGPGDLAAGVTSPHPQVLVLRVLAPRVEPAMQLLQAVRATWRQEAWGLAAEPPRIWRT